MDGYDMLDLRHEPGWAKWRKDLLRNNPPPFLGPLVTIKEAAEALDRSESYATLENRDPVEAVRQLQTERGWMKPEPVGEPTLTDPLPRLTVAKKQRKQPARPLSWSSPNPRPRTPPEPYIDPDAQSAILNPKSEIDRPFPIGWIRAPEVCNILDCSEATLIRLVKAARLERRSVPNPPTKPVYLYDSVEVERLAGERLNRVSRPLPNKNLRWWGSRAAQRVLQEFDYWITTTEAAQILNVSRARVRHMCDSGLLPCYQKEPGKMGSSIKLSHMAVTLLAKREAYKTGRARWEKGKHATAFVRGWEEYDIEGYDPRQRTGAAKIDLGIYYSTRQAAIELGISVWSVHALRKRCRLQGHKVPPHKGCPEGRQHWFFLKEDIHNLQADHEYNTHSRQGKRAQLPPSLRDTETP